MRTVFMLESLVERVKNEQLPEWLVEELRKLYKESYREGYADGVEDTKGEEEDE